ncbi:MULTISPECIES: sodium ion-translocating decarboxylase subunit beta [unclassified Imperialibacter]|uniref:sodium ion-translocating decarboxylase subunit beta n=1 Tax=unclassified Imperialibacter TaxID=2629706 RepID=UPI00125364E9|nr:MULTISPECIES: sodium ion-translocating decarboxylase subunit beta [unclassified Imperialibacter]CAD5271440.1 hypothetical protein IMPERIA89_340536 [Imperialibacter sp. 89]CAD5298822.1 hypothetical protein IMPERIA75_700535 [Imperialibacter sp. 75]VVT35064.1 hypothetical protein IMPR6_700130 [Imperialibacter sp. EC-SDR9]
MTTIVTNVVTGSPFKAARVAKEIAIKHDPSNHLLQYVMASNISGVIGSAVAAGVLISFLS